LTLGDAVNFTPINSARLAAIDGAAFAEVEAQWAFAVRELRRERLYIANEPESAHLSEQFTSLQPPLRLRAALGVMVAPTMTRTRGNLAEQSAFWMNVERRPVVGRAFDRHFILAPTIGETADPAPAHESVSLHEFEQVRFDVRANDAIGFDDRARFRIHVIPRPADLCAHPPAQGAE